MRLFGKKKRKRPAKPYYERTHKITMTNRQHYEIEVTLRTSWPQHLPSKPHQWPNFAIQHALDKMGHEMRTQQAQDVNLKW